MEQAQADFGHYDAMLKLFPNRAKRLGKLRARAAEIISQCDKALQTKQGKLFGDLP